VCLITFDKFLTNVKLFHVYIKVHNTTSDIILKNDKTIIAYHFGQYYCLLKKEWRLPKIEIPGKQLVVSRLG
jgi:hypothetical protein